MKAKVKATGEIGIVSQIDILLNDDFISFSPNKVELLTSYADASIEHSSDYWTRLEHQYAGMAMQELLQSPHLNIMQEAPLVGMAESIATALVEKLKEKEERK